MIFNKVREISKNKFIERWKLSENKREHPDPSALQRISEHEESNYMYQSIQLTKESLSRIILPIHNATHHFYKTCKNTSLIDFAEQYEWGTLEENSTDDCVKSIQFQLKEYKEQLDNGLEELERDCVYISSKSDMAVKDQKTIEDYYYAGGFHQLAAFSLFVKRYGFHPFRIFLCELKS